MPPDQQIKVQVTQTTLASWLRAQLNKNKLHLEETVIYLPGSNIVMPTHLSIIAHHTPPAALWGKTR